MYRVVTACFLVCLASLTFAQTSSSNATGPSAALQVVYVIDGSTLTTYNVDSQTLQAAEVGTTALPESVYPGVVTSPNGHVVYYTAYQNINQQGERLYVYSTNSSGVPNGQPIQTISSPSVYSVQVDPTGKFLYVVHEGTNSNGFAPFTIIRAVIDSATGKLSQPVTVANYQLEEGAESCFLSIVGMNAAGTKLYDEISCGYPHGGALATYNERSVDPQTGALGPDQKIYYWNNSSGGGEFVQFVKNLVFDFVIPNNYQQDDNEVNVYLVQPNVTTPLIQCTASMLANCGSDNFGLTHPSAQYVFLRNPQQTTDIDKVDFSSKQFLATSSTIPYEVQQFSPDGSIAYAANDVNTALDIQIYGFNVSDAQVTAGGSIDVPSGLDSWFAVERR
jgi:hypothetical protein